MADEEKKEGGKIEKKKTSKRYTNYTVSGDKVERNNQSCPKCGPGVLLAKHKDRVYCGSCHYVEMKSASDDSKKDSDNKDNSEDKKDSKKD